MLNNKEENINIYYKLKRIIGTISLSNYPLTIHHRVIRALHHYTLCPVRGGLATHRQNYPHIRWDLFENAKDEKKKKKRGCQKLFSNILHTILFNQRLIINFVPFTY